MNEDTTLERLSNLPTCHGAEPSASPDPPALHMQNCPAREPLRKRISIENLLASWMTPLLPFSHTEHKPCQQGQFPTHWHKIKQLPSYMYPDAPHTKYVIGSCLALPIPAKKWKKNPHYQRFQSARHCILHSQYYVIAQKFSKYEIAITILIS